MSDETRVEQLLDEILDSDRTPEEVCADCPELLAEVRKRCRQMRLMDAHLDSLFPTPKPDGAADTPMLLNPIGQLPHIPGYYIEDVLGRGGVGVVYQARHLRLNRGVALKMLLAGPYARPEELKRFLREAEAVAGLHHPNIVQLYDAGEADGRPYFTMELVEGGSLAQKLTGTPRAARPAAELVAKIADAIQAAHQSGIIHRDLKPANVLMAADGTPKVTDFGLARRLESDRGLTLSGAAVGTPSYMSPEQARGDRSTIGPPTDVYALGAILYEMLTGRPPFRAETATATVQQVIAEEPVSPRRLNPQVPRDLETICLKCLQKGPSERYASAAALADDLRRFERGEPITARPPGALERTAKWVRRRPTAAALLAAALLMLAGITAAAVWYAGDRARRHTEIQNRSRQVNRDATTALDQAEKHLNDLRAQLDNAPRAWELLSDIDRWQTTVDQARQDWQQAKSACDGNEALVAEEIQARIQAVGSAIDREEAAYELARKLDNIAVDALVSYDSRRSKQRMAVTEYERLFAQEGMDIRQPGTDWFASAIQSSPVRYALITALDNWAFLANEVNDPRLARLLELARAADPDPWRDHLRDPDVWRNGDELTRLASEVDVGRQSPTILVSLGALLRGNEEDPTALFERALLDHPRDFWLHLRAAIYTKVSGIKLGLAHAALAVRPWSALAYTLLARELWELRDWPEAVVAAKRAIDINSGDADVYTCLGASLRDNKDLPGAIVALKRAAELDPHNPGPCFFLGDVFLLQEDWTAAIGAYRKATDRWWSAAAFWKTGGCPPGFKEQLSKLKDQPEVIAAFQRAIELDQGDFLDRYILGQVFQQQGRYAEAEQAYLGAIKAQPACVPVCDCLARLLATCPDDKIRDGKRAVESATTACERTGWEDLFCLDTLAAAYAEEGQFDEAVRYQTRALDNPILRGAHRTAAKERLELYRQKKPFREKGP
jgi:serine/threonine-protein kinase